MFSPKRSLGFLVLLNDVIAMFKMHVMPNKLHNHFQFRHYKKLPILLLKRTIGDKRGTLLANLVEIYLKLLKKYVIVKTFGQEVNYLYFLLFI